MEAFNIFNDRADEYCNYRPFYANEFIRFIVDHGIVNSKKTIADIGCGTGILSSQLIPYVQRIYGVEPNQYMLRKAIELFANEERFIACEGTAEKTGLHNRSIDVIVAGQAFHWFDPALFRIEAERILNKDGCLILVWNKKSECVQESERQQIVNKYRTIRDIYDSNWEKRLAGIDDFFQKYNTYSFENDIVNTHDEFIGRTLSASHAVSRTDPLFYSYLQEWELFFDKYQKNGRIIIPNKTIAFIGTI